MRKLALLIGIFALSGLLWAGTAHASGMRSGDVVTVNKDESVDSTFYGAGNAVHVAGTVKGDVYCAGQTIDISGTVEGDVMCAGQDVRITGKVTGNVRAAAQNLSITGSIGQSATLLGQSVSIEKSASIGRDTTIGSQTAYIGGKAGRDVVAMGNTLTFAGHVGRDVSATGETTHVQSSAHIMHDFHYTSNNQATVDAGASIVGTTMQHQPAPEHQQARSQTAAWASSVLYWFAAVFVTGLILWLLMPKWLQSAAGFAKKRALASVGLGMATMFLTPIVAVLLMVTIVGIPLGIFLGVAWAFALFVSFVLASYTLGHWLAGKVSARDKWHDVIGLLAGSLLLVLLGSLPVIGGLACFLILVWGMGALALTIHQTLRRQRPQAKPAK